MPASVRSIASALLPVAAREWLMRKRAQISADPPAGSVSFGDLRRTTPIGRMFGLDRGRGIDRYYIESFLDEHRGDIRGRVLEIGDDTYARRFGSAVAAIDVLHVEAGQPRATIVADLTKRTSIEDDRFDCAILTQTLPFVTDPAATVRELHRIMASGGVVLATVPCISQISRYDADRWGDYWRFTSMGARALFAREFAAVETRTYGNALSAVALLEGLASEELTREELDAVDADYEVTVGVRAVK